MKMNKPPNEPTEALRDIADRIKRQADCLDRYAEQSGFKAEPVPSVFHFQASHFRDLAKELAALTNTLTVVGDG
jgi:hypothetical protein